MAKTDLFKYTEQEKLNKMQVDYITVTPSVSDGSTDANNELLFDALEIPNAVAVDGGTAILQSIAVFHKANESVAFDIVFFQVTQDLGTAGEALTWGGGGGTTEVDFADAAVLMGHTTITDWSSLADVTIATKTNIGLVLQAAEGTKSIYCAGICRGAATGDHDDASNIDIRFGIIKD